MSDQSSINWTGGAIAAGIVVILGFVTGALVFAQVPADNQNALTLLIGILSANVGTIVGFYFGSSSSSKKQVETIATLANTASSAQAALPSSAPDAVQLPAGESVVIKAEEDKPKD